MTPNWQNLQMADPLSDDDIARYSDLLTEVKGRIDLAYASMASANEIAGDPANTALMVTNEVAALHLRKALELVLLGSLVTQRASMEEVVTALHKKDAEEARRLARRLNLKFWPQPHRQVQVAPGRFELAEETGPYLRDEDFGPAFGLASSLVHARNPYLSPRDSSSDRKRLVEVADGLVALLNHHVIELVGGQHILIAMMQNSTTETVQVAYFSRYGDSPPP